MATARIGPSTWSRPHPVLAGIAIVLLPAVMVFVLAYKFDIPLVFLAGIGFAGVCVMMMRPMLATVGVTFVLYSNLAVIAKQQHNVSSAIAGSVVLLLFIPLFRYLVVDSEAIVVNRAFKVMLAYFVVLCATAIASTDPSLSKDRLISYAVEGILLYLMFLNVVRTTTTLKRVIWTIVGVGVLVGSLSIYQGITKSYRHTFWGLAQVQRVDEETGAPVPPRVAGQVGETNRYSQVMLVLLPLAAVPFFTNRGWRKRGIALGALIIITGAVVLTFSRSAGVTMLFFASLLWWFGYVKLRHMAVLFLGAALLLVVLTPQFVTRMSTLITATHDLNRADGALRGRATENIGVLRIFLDHPVLGVGTGQAPLYMEQYANGAGFRRLNQPRRGHNMYLEELADTGVIGFSVLMAIAIVTIRELSRQRKYWMSRQQEYGHLLTALLMSLYVYLFSALFLHLSYMRYYYLLLALCGAACVIMRQNAGVVFSPAPITPLTTRVETPTLVSRSERRSRL